MITIHKYHCCNKFITCTSCIIVIQGNFSNAEQNIIQRIIICHKTGGSSKSNSKSWVIYILIVIDGKNYKDKESTNENIDILNVGKETDSIEVYVLLLIVFQNFVLIIIIQLLNLFHIIKGYQICNSIFKYNYKIIQELIQNVQVDDNINKYILVHSCCDGWIHTRQIVSGKRLILCDELIFGKARTKNYKQKTDCKTKGKEQNKRN